MKKIAMDFLPRMVIFAKVVELGAFAKAATELGLTSSSVSQHISALESYVGTRLLHRTTRKLCLTEAGKMFYENCRRMTLLAEEARQGMEVMHHELVGGLSIAASSFMAANYLVPALKEFIDSHPKLKIAIDVDDHNVDLIASNIDLALRVGRAPDEGDIYLSHLETVLCASPDYLATHAAIVEPESLREHDFLFFTPHGAQVSIEMCNMRGEVVRLRLQPRVSANHALSLHRLVLQGHGVARLLMAKIESDVKAGRLVVILPQWTLPGYQAYLTTCHRNPMPLKIQTCIEHIQRYFALRHPPQSQLHDARW